MSFGPQSQRDFDAGGLRYGQIIANLDFSREYDLGFAKPLSIAFGGEYRNENFDVRPGEPQSFQIGPFFRAAVPSTTAVNCATLGGVFISASSTCTFPGRAAAVGAQGFPGIPTSSLANVTRDSFAFYGEVDTDIFKGFTHDLWPGATNNFRISAARSTANSRRGMNP